MLARFLNNVRFVGRNITVTPVGSSLLVTWPASRVADGYRIELSDDSVVWTSVVVVNQPIFDEEDLETDPPIIEYTILNVGWNIAKYVRVIGFNSFGDSDAPLSPIQIWMPPQYPPSGLTVESLTPYSATLSFVTPPSLPANGGYIVQSSLDGNTEWDIEIETSSSPIIIEGLSPVSTYKFRIFSYNNYGEDQIAASPVSPEITATTPQEMTPPEWESTIISPNAVTLNRYFSEPVTATNWSGWTLNLTRGPITGTYASGDGSDIIMYDLSRTVYNDETGTDSYIQSQDGIRDLAGNLMESASGLVVTNGSIQGIYDISENFESPAVSPGWTVFPSTTWSSTDAPIEGGRSLLCLASGAARTPIFNPRSKWYAYYRTRHSTTNPTGDRIKFAAYDSNGVIIFQLSSTNTLVHRLRVGPAGSFSAGSYQIVGNADYHFWFDFDTSNGNIQFRVSLDGIRPPEPTLSIPTSTATSPVVQAQLNNTTSGTGAARFDHFRCGPLPIGSNPS